MSAAFQVETRSEVEPAPVETPVPTRPRQDVIRNQVLAALGRPARLLRVAVLPLWGNKFRVNVWTSETGAGNGIPNSYFVTADEHGNVVRSEPPILKQY